MYDIVFNQMTVCETLYVIRLSLCQAIEFKYAQVVATWFHGTKKGNPLPRSRVQYLDFDFC